MKKITIIIIILMLIFLISGYFLKTYLSFGKLERNMSCGEEFESLIINAIKNENPNLCNQSKNVNSYRHYFYDIKNSRWKWSPCKCLINIEEYGPSGFYVDCQTNTLREDHLSGVENCIDYVNERIIRKNSEFEIKALIEIYDYYIQKERYPSLYSSIIGKIIRIDDPIAIDFITRILKDKSKGNRITTIDLLKNMPNKEKAEELLIEIIQDNLTIEYTDEIGNRYTVSPSNVEKIHAAESLVILTGNKHKQMLQELAANSESSFVKNRINNLFKNN